MAVPRLGELGHLEVVVDPAAPGAARWSASRACLLGGVVAVLLGAGVAGGLRGQRAGVAPVDEQAIRAAIAPVAADELHAAWITYEQRGIARPAVPEESRRLRHATALKGLETAAWILALAGVLVAVGGGILAVRAPRGVDAPRP